jgi:(S)-2-hydroxyglutarate dehydrogenase
MDAKFDGVIIGGGIVGLSVAWAALNRNPGAKIAILEKEDRWAAHQTGRNSGVIHSGIYYKPGSSKALLAREGNRRLKSFCKYYGIAYEETGKVIVATEEAELPLLENLYNRGLANGLEVEKLSAAEVREKEPYVRSLAGLSVPSTGIVDFIGVAKKLAWLVREKGGRLYLDTRVLGFKRNEGRTVIETSRGEITTRWFVNCAGLHSDRVARLAGAKPGAKIVPFRGEYYELKPERRGLVKGLIYPVPDPKFPFLGVHFTRMIDGSVHAGPNAVLSLKREGYSRTSFDFRDFAETMTYGGFWRLAAKNARAGLEEIYRSFSKRAFTHSLQKLIPDVREEDLIVSGAGVRAQALKPDGAMVDDFLIVPDPLHTGSVHVCNAPSPAATASLEIGRAVVEGLAMEVKVPAGRNVS